MPNDRPSSDLSPTDIVGAFESFTGSVGDYIANGQPETQIGQAIQQAYRNACDSYSNAPSWVTGLNPTNRAILDNMCQPWLDSQGSGGPVLQFPFTGGQCAVAYIARFEGTWTRNNSLGGQDPPESPQTPSFSPLFGPITDAKYVVQGAQRRIRFQASNAGGLIADVTVASWGSNQSLAANNLTFRFERVDGQPDNCGNPPGTPGPNPNPRPNPGLPPSEEPFVDDRGRPVVPIPPITDPLGEPVELPNIPLPDLLGSDPEAGEGNPNVAPAVEPASPQDGNGNSGGDDDFGDPPEGHQWVGFIVKLSDQGLTEGLEVNSPPHPIYKSQTGSYRGKYDVNGDTVYSTPRPIKQETSAYFLELPGLQLAGARVNVPGNDSYTITPLSQPVESTPEE